MLLISQQGQIQKYRNLVSENAHNSKKLWQVLLSALHSVPETVLSFHDPQKCLANSFVTFCSDPVTKIMDSSSRTDSFTLPSHVPYFDFFKTLFDDELRKSIIKSSTKSFLSDPWPTFLVKE